MMFVLNDLPTDGQTMIILEPSPSSSAFAMLQLPHEIEVFLTKASAGKFTFNGHEYPCAVMSHQSRLILLIGLSLSIYAHWKIGDEITWEIDVPNSVVQFRKT